MNTETIIKYLAGNLSKREKRIFFLWVNESKENMTFFASLKNAWELFMANEAYSSKEEQDRKFAALCRKLQLTNLSVPLPLRKKSFALHLLPYAAMIALILTIGGLVWFWPDKSRIEERTFQFDPGTQNATLALPDGRMILLDSIQNGILAEEGTIKILKLNDGQLQYSDSVSSSLTSNINTQIPEQVNTLTTPRGGEYQIALPDGTKVWLNASSSLKFPMAFSGTDRRVEVKGEAYFEVAKNDEKPFIVNVNNKVEIKVLGTHFNINSYEDEANIKTTLVEGSVEISSLITHKSLLIIPGQQALIDHQGNIESAEVDVREFTLWKEGWFYFNDQSLEDILRKLSRWYDFTYTVKPGLAQQHFSIKIKRFESFNTIVDILEKTGMVRFETDGKMIMVI